MSKLETLGSHAATKAGATERLLSLLDSAYETAEDPKTFDAMFIEANAFFFADPTGGALVADLPDTSEFEPTLQKHINRIQRLIEKSELEQSAQLQDSHASRMASLVISNDGLKIVGNSVAAKMMGVKFPISLMEMPLAPKVTKEFGAILHSLKTGKFEGSSTILFQLAGETINHVAKCTKLQNIDSHGHAQSGLGVTISHMGWHRDSLAFAKQSFGLTGAETDLLEVFLTGASQSQAAQLLKKKPETIKSQAKAILRKSGQRKMFDVVGTVLSHAFLAGPEKEIRGPRKIMTTPVPEADIMTMKDGRKVQVSRFGKAGGRPILFTHGLIYGPYFSDRMNAIFAEHNLDVVAPSRPGFNRTDPPAKWGSFNTCATKDAIEVCDQLGIKNVTLLVHQAGASFACRTAAQLGPRASGMMMVAAGIPIKDHMMGEMNLQTRVSAASARYAPMMFDMLIRIGIGKWRRQGPRAYLENFFTHDSAEFAALNHPEYGPLLEQGALHMISQGPKTVVHDGISAMTDWTADYLKVKCPQLWMHGDLDPVLNFNHIIDFLEQHDQSPPVIIPGTGTDLLYSHFDDVIERLVAFPTV